MTDSAQIRYTVTPEQLKNEILHCFRVGLIPMTESSPGMGKSSIYREVARENRLYPIDIRLGQCTPEDLNGFPMRNGDKASFVPFDMFPLEGDPIPEGYDGWMIFFDEITSATKPVQAAAYKILLDRMVGSKRLHPNVVMGAAGNKSTDRAVVNAMSTALRSRVISYELTISLKEFRPVAYKLGFDSRVLGYLNMLPSKLMDFRPEHQIGTFPCPRTWEFLSRLVKGEEISEEIAPRIAGAIGAGEATEFITFAKEFDRLPKIHEIVSSPKTLDIPREASTKYATMAMVVEHITEQNLDDILDYVKRFDIEMQIVFCRSAVAKYPAMRHSHKGFGAYLLTMMRYLQ